MTWKRRVGFKRKESTSPTLAFTSIDRVLRSHARHMTPLQKPFRLLFAALALATFPTYGEDDLSPCLTTCLTPMVRIEKSIAYVYRNYERVSAHRSHATTIAASR